MWNVDTRRLPARTASAAMALESTPPDKKTPSGTSLTKCWRAAVSSSLFNASTASDSERLGGAASDQYVSGRAVGASRRTRNDAPGLSNEIPRIIVQGPTAKPL